MIWLLTFLLLFLAAPINAQSQSSVPHSGIGACPSGQVVNRLNPNAAPSCVTNGSGGSSFPLTGDVSGAGHKIQNLGAASTSGDPLIYLQTSAVLNGLSLNSMQLTGLAPASGVNQALAWGQTGGQLNGLNLNSNQLSNLSNANGAGQAIAYDQSAALLIDLILSPAATFPATPSTGDKAIVNTASVCISGSTIVLGGSTLCEGLWNGSNWVAGGGSSGAAAGPINTLPSQTATYHANKQAMDQLGNLTADITSPRSLSDFNVDNKFNVLAYGADPTAATDSYTAVQAAVNAACAAQQVVSGAVNNTPTFWAPAGQYFLSKPIIVACAGGSIRVEGAGAGATDFVQKTNALGHTAGPLFIDVASNAASSIAPTTATSLATGAGAALNFIGSDWEIDLGQTMKNFGGPPNNGAAALDTNAQLDLRAFAKLASAQTNGAVIFCSNGKADEQNPSALKFVGLGPASSQGGAACMWVDGNLALHCAMNIGGVLKTAVSANSAFTTATTHEPECSYDGANLREFLDGTIGTTTAATGNISQRVDEDMTIGGNFGVYPLTSPQALWVGQLDSIEVSNTARHTSNYTMDTNKFPGDSHSILLLNGDITVNFPGSSTPFVFGLDRWGTQNMVGSNFGAYNAIDNIALASGGGGNQFDHFGGVGEVGILGYIAQNSRYDNLALTGNYAGILLDHSSFNTRQSNLVLATSTFASYMDVDSSGITAAKDLQLNNCGIFCAIVSGSGGSWHHIYTAPQSRTQWSLLVNNCGNGPNNFKFDDAALDVENGGNSTGVLAVCGGSYSFTGGGITSAGTASPFTVSSTDSHDNIAIHIADMPIGFAQLSSGGPSTLFNFEGSYPTNGSASALMSNDTYINGSNNAAPTIPSGMDFSNNASFQVEKVGVGGWALANNVTWPLPTTVDIGGNFFCPNCDPATNPPTDCTMTKSTTPGSWVRGVNGRWLCY